ncbi:MAG: sulfate ABC transporter permease subunit CysW [Gemmataceae bacterium]
MSTDSGSPRPGSGGEGNQRNPWYVRYALIGLTVAIVGVLIAGPLVFVFAQAFARGVPTYVWSLVGNPDTRHAIFLTLAVAPLAVAMNTAFGVAAAWLIARYRFRGRGVLLALIDLPFSVSPVVAGLAFVLIFGLNAPLGGWLKDRGFQVLFAPPGLVLVSAFVTLPFIARELIPVLEAVGPDEELAAVSLGASGWQTFWRVTVPNVRWGLLYGVILANARAMGEFGAVYVVSGRIAGATNTMPLQVDRLFQDHDLAGAFALASVLAGLALVTLLAKVTVGERLRGGEVGQSPEGRDDMSIQVRGLSKRFGAFAALDGVSLDVAEGELLALLGPSGSGKTTLLRVIAGLEVPDAGQVLHEESDVTRRSARDRAFGFVFQHYALFRHMTVFENVAFSLRVRNWKDADVRERVNELLALVRLEGLGPRYPSQLSGGQRQRVALARALASRPRVLLLDEPFGALDAKVRAELRQWLRRLHDESPVTTVFVTHDQEEAFEVADRVVVMNKGKVEQAGSPRDVFDHPATPFVMDFVGRVNVFHGRLHGGKAFVGGLELDCPEHDGRAPGPAWVYVRPHELELETRRNGTASLAARVAHVSPAGAVIRVLVTVGELGRELSVEVPSERYAELGLSKGDDVFVSARRVRVFVPPEPDYSI